MEIIPDSTIKFLRNIPFDNDYNDTIYFDNPNQQFNYFSGIGDFASNDFVKYEISKQYYARHSANVLDVELPNPQSGVDPSTGVRYSASTTESLYDCNYIMFCNNSFKRVTNEGYALPKWFYAFITDVEYVNNQVARVTFEIDVLQTWMFDYDLEQCFIEREHSASDEIGENIVAEKVDMGNTYITSSIVNKIASYKEMSVITLAGRDNMGYPTPILLHNIPTTLHGYEFNLYSQFELFKTYINYFTSDTSSDLTPDDIVSIYLFPTQNIAILEPGKGIIDGDVVSITRPTSFQYITNRQNSSSIYIPKNKKLYTYPYMGIEVSNHEGTSELYQYEYFINDENLTPKYEFKIRACSQPSPALIMYPQNYIPSQSKTGVNTLNSGYDYGVAISDFQQCGWTGDAFKAWWAQNKSSFVTSASMGTLSGILAIGAGAAMENPVLGLAAIIGGVISVGASVGGAVAKVDDIKHQPAVIKGLSNSLSLPIAMDYFGYTLRAKTIPAEYAEIIDEYFTMFGYATHRVKTPNIHVRERCTYTKTIGCTIKGRLPSVYQKKICKIFDNGIRFWSHDSGVNVGVYRDPIDGELYDNACL